MKPWANFFRVIILIAGIIVLSFDTLLYNSFEQQRSAINTFSDQQKAESRANGNKFKYQQDQIEGLSEDLEDARQRIKDQNIALAQQKDALAGQKDVDKDIQTSLVDIQAEADAIKQDMKGWQKDYVSVLAQLEKKMDDSQDEMKSVKEGINSLKADIEKIAHPADNSLPGVPPKPETKDKDADQP